MPASPGLSPQAASGPGLGRSAVRCVPGVAEALRFDLQHLLEPHGLSLQWAGKDLSSAALLDTIVSDIERADMCLFDNLGTLHRPNVYIEIGIAYAFEKPMIVCEYVGKQPRSKAVPETATIPSDLAGLLRIQYKSYEDLCRQLYFGLPSFFRRHRLTAALMENRPR
jgi:hypothetical protein